mgnify:CR=1 FL=1
MSLVNMDLVLVKVFFSPAESGVYSLAQMIGKAFLYLPVAISIVILPRASSLNAQNLDTRPILKKSLLIALLLCALAILIYNLFPYAVLRILTGKTLPQSVFIGRLFSLSMTFYTLLYILITYFLSIKDLRFIKILGTLTVFQLLGLVFFHQTLIQVQGVLCVSSFVLCASHFYLLRKTPELSSQRAR